MNFLSRVTKDFDVGRAGINAVWQGGGAVAAFGAVDEGDAVSAGQGAGCDGDGDGHWGCEGGWEEGEDGEEGGGSHGGD